MAGQRIRVTRLETVGQCAIENAKVYRELRRGKLEACIASRLSAIILNQRCILETVDAEKRIEQLEALLQASNSGKLIQIIVRWSEPRVGYHQVAVTTFKRNPANVF